MSNREHRFDDGGLSLIAQHNALSNNGRAAYQQPDSAGHDLDFGTQGMSHGFDDFHETATPSSNAASEGRRTRSGRSTRKRTESPLSSRNGISKSPASRPKKNRKTKSERNKPPKLTAPLSILTEGMSVPLKDMDAWVHRSAEVRREEVAKRNGYVTRPMNSFMLYRSAYAERTKQWCTQNNHQIVSSVSGESWPMEPQEVRDRFNELAKIERDNHQAAHPEYKFSPSKPANKRRKDDDDDDDDGDEGDPDVNDPDGDYRAPRSAPRKRDAQQEAATMNQLYGFEAHPYYGHQVPRYPQEQYEFVHPGQPLPAAVANMGQEALAFDPQSGQYLQSHRLPSHRYQVEQNVHSEHLSSDMMARLLMEHQQQQQLQQQQPQPQSSSIGGYGLPGGEHPSVEEWFSDSRTSTPMQQQQQQPFYPQYSTLPSTYPTTKYEQSAIPVQAVSQAQSEHQEYLMAASRPQTAIDPGLEANYSGGFNVQDASHFDDAFSDMKGFEEFYTEPPSGGNGGMLPPWSPNKI